jgi:peptidoglycan/LPS O-acetylase OafA/YrhL
MLLTYYGLKDSPPKQEYIFLQVVDWFYACRDFVQPFHNYNNESDIIHRYEWTMWTLPLEIYGSVICYLTVMAVARITHPVKRSAVVLLFTWFAAVKGNWWSTNFLIGMLHADFMIWQGKTERSLTTSFTVKCLWGGVFIWALYLAGLPDAHYEEYNLPGFDWYYHNTPMSWQGIEGGGRFWWMISGITLTVSISQVPLLRKIFETRLCQYLGRISFMLYLVHMYVFELVGRMWKNMLSDLVAEDVYSEETKTTTRIARGNGLYFVYFGFWIVMLPVVLIVAGQVTKYVDDPSIRFAKWLETKFIEDDDGKEIASSIPV